MSVLGDQGKNVSRIISFSLVCTIFLFFIRSSDNICPTQMEWGKVWGKPEKFCEEKCDARRVVIQGVVSESCTIIFLRKTRAAITTGKET